MEETIPKERKFRPSVKITAALMVLVSIAGFFELTARVVYAYRDALAGGFVLSGFLQKSFDLDPYEMQVPGKTGHWVLRPGYRASLANLRAGKKKRGREIGLRGLMTNPKDQGRDDKNYIRINKDGFKGEDIDPSHTRPRILVVGDSVTFGLGTVSYPKIMSRELMSKGVQAEVINPGVEGYASRNVLWEMGRYKSLKPEIALVFIGWNDLFKHAPWLNALENSVRIVWLLKKATRALTVFFGDAEGQAKALYFRNIISVRNHSDVTRLAAYRPPVLDHINQIINEFKAMGTDVVLVTLPGLFTMQETPSPKALKIGHLPYFTDNSFVLAKLTERYNSALMELALRRGVGIIDLDTWSREALMPRETFFFDSVHLTAAGLTRVGKYMANRAMDHLAALHEPTSAIETPNRQ